VNLSHIPPPANLFILRIHTYTEVIWVLISGYRKCYLRPEVLKGPIKKQNCKTKMWEAVMKPTKFYVCRYFRFKIRDVPWKGPCKPKDYLLNQWYLLNLVGRITVCRTNLISLNWWPIGNGRRFDSQFHLTERQLVWPSLSETSCSCIRFGIPFSNIILKPWTPHSHVALRPVLRQTTVGVESKSGFWRTDL
jgi:hypothetical protein